MLQEARHSDLRDSRFAVSCCWLHARHIESWRSENRNLVADVYKIRGQMGWLQMLLEEGRQEYRNCSQWDCRATILMNGRSDPVPYLSFHNQFEECETYFGRAGFSFSVKTLFLFILHRWRTFRQPTNLYCEMKNIDGVKRRSVRWQKNEKSTLARCLSKIRNKSRTRVRSKPCVSLSTEN